MLHFKLFRKTFNLEFIKSPFLETVKIKIVISLVTTSGNIDFDFTEKSQYFIGKHMDRVKRIWYLSPMRAAKVQASLRIRAVSPEPPLLAHTSSKSRGTFRQKAKSLAPLNGWACAVKICHDEMLEDTNWFDGAHIRNDSISSREAKHCVATHEQIFFT